MKRGRKRTEERSNCNPPLHVTTVKIEKIVCALEHKRKLPSRKIEASIFRDKIDIAHRRVFSFSSPLSPREHEQNIVLNERERCFMQISAHETSEFSSAKEKKSV